MQPRSVRFARTRFSLIALSLLLPFAQPASADPSGDYQGWLWETGVFTGFGFSEESCFAQIDLAFAVDLNWTAGLTEDVCWGRTTTNTGRTENNFPPFVKFNDDPDQSTQPLVGAGGNLYELYGEEFEQGVGQGEERFGTLLSLPSNDNLIIAGGYDSEADQFSEDHFRYVDLLVKSTAATKNARVTTDLEGTSWRIATYAHELATTNVNIEFTLSTVATIDLQANGVCSYSNSTVFPDFVDNGDIYRALQFDNGIDFDDRTVRGGTDERDISNCTYAIDADKYLAITRTRTRALDPGNPVTFTSRFVVSDDNRHLVPAPSTVTEDSPRSLTVGYRAASQLATNAIDNTYLFYLSLSEFGADGAGAAAAGFGPRDWQEFDLLGRGKLVFDSTTVSTTPAGESGTWNACTMDMTLGEVEHEFVGSTNDSSVTLSNFTADSGDLAFDECDFQLSADGGLRVRLFLDEGNPDDDFEIILRGYVNDNGEILSLTANNVDGDPLNPGNINKDLASVFFALAMKYTGDLDGDADGDRVTNFEEFKIPLPPESSVEYGDITTFSDVTGDATPDVAGFVDETFDKPRINVYSGDNGDLHSSIDFINDNWQGTRLGTVRDANQDGTADDPAVAMLVVNKTTGKIRVESRRIDTGASLSSVQFLNEKWQAVDVVVVDDLNGDGNTNDTAIAVLAQRFSDGRIQVQLRNLVGGALVSNVVYLNARWTAVAAAVADRSAIAPAGTLAPVIGVIAEKADDGKRTMQSRIAGAGTFDQNIKFLGSTWNYHDVSVNHDANGDGTNDDPIWQVLATRPSDNVIRVQSRQVSDGAFDSNIVILSSAWEGLRLDTGMDISGNGSQEMAISALRRADDVKRIHIKDFASRSTTTNVAP